MSLDKLAAALTLLAHEIKTANYVNWDEGDVLKLEPVPSKLQRHYPSSTLSRREKVMADSSGSSDRDVYEGVTGGGRSVQFYGWQVVDKDRS